MVPDNRDDLTKPLMLSCLWTGFRLLMRPTLLLQILMLAPKERQMCPSLCAAIVACASRSTVLNADDTIAVSRWRRREGSHQELATIDFPVPQVGRFSLQMGIMIVFGGDAFEGDRKCKIPGSPGGTIEPAKV